MSINIFNKTNNFLIAANNSGLENQQESRDDWKFTGMDEYGKDISKLMSAPGYVEHVTLYGYPSGRIEGRDKSFADMFAEQSIPGKTSALINREWDDYKQAIVDNAKPAVRYGARLETLGVDVDYTNYQLHSKTLLKSINGVETLFIGTGNFTKGAMMDDPLRYRQAAADGRTVKGNTVRGNIDEFKSGLVGGVIDTIVPGAYTSDVGADELTNETMSQVNFGVTTTNAKIIGEYKEVIENIKQGKAISTEHLIVGGPGGTARERHLEFINRAKSKIDIISPFIDDSAIANELVDRARAGIHVRVVTLPFESDYKKGAGGSIAQRLEFTSRAFRGGVELYMANADSPLMVHAKAIAVDESEAILGSINQTEKSFDRSFEMSAVTDKGKEVSASIQELIDTGRVVKVTDETQGPRSVRMLRERIVADRFGAMGMLNQEYAHLVAGEYTSITLSASAGSSYHYGKALNKTLMNQAGYYNLGAPLPVMGAAESIMRTNALLLHDREPTNRELAIARSFDVGFNTPGLGMWMNEKVFLPMGWGRVYKDEIGALPSLAGLAGRILDEGYLYYANTVPDYMMLGQDVKNSGYSPYDSHSEGIFETFFAKTSEFSIASLQAVGMYMAVSQPIEMLKANMSKNYLQGQLTDVFRVGAKERLDASGNIDEIARSLSKFDWAKGGIEVTHATLGRPLATAGDNLAAPVARALIEDIPFGSRYLVGKIVDSAYKPGGIAGAMMLQKYVQLKAGEDAFFAFNVSSNTQSRTLVSSMYSLGLTISRERGARILENVFQPFLEDFINPFDPSARGVKALDNLNMYQVFNRSVQNLIDEVRRPPDINFVSTGAELHFNEFGFNVNQSDFSLANVDEAKNNIVRKLAAEKVNLNDANIHLRPEFSRFNVVKGTTITEFDVFIEKTTSRIVEIDSKLAKLYDQKTAIQSIQTHGSAYSDVKELDMQIQMLGSLKNRYMMQLQENASKILPELEHVGVGYKLKIASVTQDILNIIPLNPFKWGALGRNLTSYDDTLMIGELFSFRNSAELISDAITGDNVMTRILRNAQAILPEVDKVQRGSIATANQKLAELKARKNALVEVHKEYQETVNTGKISKTEPLTRIKNSSDVDALNRVGVRVQSRVAHVDEQISKQETVLNALHANRLDAQLATNLRTRIISFDRTVKDVSSYIFNELKGGNAQQKSIEKTSRMFRNWEDNAIKSKGPGAVSAVSANSDSRKQMISIAGDSLTDIVDKTGNARVFVQADFKDAATLMNEFIEASSAYHSEMVRLTGLGINEGEYLSRAIQETTTNNLAGQISHIKAGRGAAILAEGGLLKQHWLGALVIFSAIALDSVFQSTGSGASLMDQTALLIGGADYQLSVEARGNKILPVAEKLNAWYGWDTTIVNSVLSTGTIGGALLVGRQLAKSQATQGYMPYHKSYEEIKYLTTKPKAEEGAADIAASHQLYHWKYKNGVKTFEAIEFDDVITNKVAVVYLGDAKASFDGGSMKGLARFTITGDNVFRSDAFLQTVHTKMGASTLMWGTLALLALGGVRNSVAGALNAMSDGQDLMDLGAGMAGLTAGGFALGAAFQVFTANSTAAVSTNLAAEAGAGTAKYGLSVAQRLSRLGKNRAMPWLGAAVGATFGMVASLKRSKDRGMFDKSPGGSMDPLAAGLAGATLVGILSRCSPSGALLGAITFGSAASVLNWAGLKWLKTGDRSMVSDSEQAGMVSQLQQFSSTVLQNRDNASFLARSSAAYAAHYGKSIQVISEEFGDRGEDVRVVARQSPLPFLQFFTAERISNPRSGEFGEGMISETGQMALSIGVQTGPIFGTSISVELPVVYTPKRGFMGLSYNPDSNLMNLFEFTGEVGAWAALSLGLIEVGSNILGKVLGSNILNKIIPGDFFRNSGEQWLEASKAVGSTHRLITTSMSKVNSIAISTLSRTLIGLHSVDSILTLHRAMLQANYSNDVLRTALQLDLKNGNYRALLGLGESADVSLEVAIKEGMGNSTFAREVLSAHHQYNEVLDRGDEYIVKQARGIKFANYAGIGGSLVLGFLIGASVAVAGKALYDMAITESSTRLKDIQDRAAETEETMSKSTIGTIILGGGSGVLLSAARKSFNVVRFVDDSGVNKTIITYSLPGRSGVWTDRGDSKVYKMIKQFDERIANLKSSPFIAKNGARLISKGGRLGITVATAAAIFASQYMRISSEFGLVQYMDSYLLYDKEGQGGSPTKVRKKARGHQIMVAGGLTAIYGSALMFTARPMQTKAELLVNFAIDNSTQKLATKSKGILIRVADTLLPSFFKDYRSLGRDGEVLEIMHRTQQQMYRVKAYNQLDPKVQQSIMAAQNALDPRYKAAKLNTLFEHLGGEEEINTFMKLHAKKKAGVEVLAVEELDQYDGMLKKLHDIGKTGATNSSDELFKTVSGLAKQRKIGRLSKKLMAVFTVMALTQKVGQFVGNLGGTAGVPGKETNLERVYINAARHGTWGSMRDGHKVGFWEGRHMIAADILRIFLNRDRIDISLVDRYNKTKTIQAEKLNEAPLIGKLGEYRQVGQDLKTLQDLLVVDQANAYIATLDFGGKTLRKGERGTYTSSYFQLQGVGHDISTASYSMATKFIFKDYAAGRGQASQIISNAVGRMTRGEIDYEDASVMIRNATSQVFALKNARKYRRHTVETEGLISGSAIVAATMAARENELEHIAWQPIESLFTNSFFETMDKAKYRLAKSAQADFFQSVTQNDRDSMRLFNALTEEGAFGNMLTSSAIKNVIFYRGFGKAGKVKNKKVLQDMASIWNEETSIAVEMEKYKQADSQFKQAVIDNVINPISTTSILTFAPKPLQFLVAGGALATVGLWTLQTAAKSAKARDFNMVNSDQMDFWGRAEAGFAPKTTVDTNSHAHLEAKTDEIYSTPDKNERRSISRGARNQSGILSSEVTKKDVGAIIDGKEGRYYVVNRQVGGKTYRYKMSQHVDNVGVGTSSGAEVALTADKARNNVMNAIETYGDRLKHMNYITLPKGSAGIVERKSIKDTMLTSSAAAELETKILTKYTDNTAVLGNLNNAAPANGGVNAILSANDGNSANMKKAAQEVLYQHAKENFQKVRQNFLNAAEGSPLMEMHWLTVGGQTNQYYLFEILGDRIEADGRVKPSMSNGMSTTIGVTDLDARKAVLNDIINGVDKWMDEAIHDVLNQHLSGAGGQRLAKDLVGQLNGVTGAARDVNYIMVKIVEKIQTHDQFKKLLTSSGGLLRPEDLPKSQALQQSVNNMLHRVLFGKGGKAGELYAEDALQYGTKHFKVGHWSKLMGGVGIATDIYSLVSDSVYALDTYGAYMRLGEAYASPYATGADRAMAKRELGHSIFTSALGVVMNFAMLKFVGPVAGKIFKHWKTSLAIATAVGVGAVAMSAASKNVIKPILHRAGAMFEESRALKRMGESFTTNSGVVEEAIGGIAGAPVAWGADLGGAIGGAKGRSIGAYGTAGALGGAAGGAIIGLSIYTMGSLVGTLAAGAAALAGTTAVVASAPITLSIVGVAAVAGLIVGGLSGAIWGSKLTEMSTKAIREIPKIPFVGEWFGGFMTKPYQHSRDKASLHQYALVQDSPFLLGYVGEVVNNKWMKVLEASEDYTGRDMASNLFGEVLDTSERSVSAWRIAASEGMIGGPASITDAVVDRELNLRAAKYADEVVGRYGWEEIKKYSDNSLRVEQQERQIKSYQTTQRQLYKTALLKSMLKAANDVDSGTKIGAHNPTVTAAADAQLDKVMKANEVAKEGYSVKHVSVTTNKDNVKNTSIEQAQEISKAVLGPGSIPPVVDVTHSATIAVDGNKVYTNFKVEASSQNDGWLQTLSSNNLKPMEVSQQSQVNIQNLHRSESLDKLNNNKVTQLVPK